MSEHQKNLLTLAFLDREPGSAARALESIETVDAAAFLNRAPARLVAPAVAVMIPWSAARCVEKMGAEQASNLLRAMEYSDAVSILRIMDEDQRERLLDLSTKRFARSFRNSLIYPKDTVGAWMDVSIPTFQHSILIKDTVRAVRRMSRTTSHIFLTDSDKQFAGVVQLADLFRRDENATLAEIADHSIRPLSNRDSLHACSAKAEWDRLTLLPVVGRKHNFLGALSRAALRKAMQDQDAFIRVATPGSVLMQLLSAFVTVGAAFVNLTLVQDDALTAQTKKEKNRGRKRKSRNQ